MFISRNASESYVESEPMDQNTITLIAAAFQFMTKQQQLAVQSNGGVVSQDFQFSKIPTDLFNVKFLQQHPMMSLKVAAWIQTCNANLVI